MKVGRIYAIIKDTHEGNVNMNKWIDFLRQRYQAASFRTILFIYCSLVLTFVLSVLGILIYTTFRSYYLTEFSRSRVHVLQQVQERIGTVKENATTLSNLYFYDQRIRSSENNQQLNQILTEVTNQYQYVFESLNSTMYVAVVSDSFVFNSIGNVYGYADAYDVLSRLPLYVNTLDESGRVTWSNSYQDTSFYSFYRQHVVSAVRMMDESVLLVTIMERMLYSIYQTLLDNENAIFIIDENGTIISHPMPYMIGENYFDSLGISANCLSQREHYLLTRNGNQRMFVIRSSEMGTGWTLIEEVPLHLVIGIVVQMRNIIITICVISILFCMFLSYYFSFKVSLPLQSFCKSMRKMRDGKLNAIANAGGFLEIEELRDAFNVMSEEINHLLDRIKKEERLKSQSELQFLQAQIRPHFIKNTVFSIKCMIALGKNDEAEKMTTAFMAMLDAVLLDNDELITIEEELKYLQQYVLLISHCYPQRFTIQYDVNAEILECKILKLLLQPLVENCIHHAIGTRNTPIDIKISGDRKPIDICLEIYDNGVGIDEKTMAKIWKEDKKEPYGLNGIGLKNIKERIQLLFGENYGIEIASVPGQYTKVSVTIPDIL